MRFSIIVGAILLASAATAPASANLIVNGDFEAIPVPAAGQFIIEPNGNQLTGWTVQGGTNPANAGLLIDTNYSETGGNPGAQTIFFQSNDGNVSYDITAAGNTGNNYIYQSFATVANRRYNISFALGNAPGNNRNDPRYLEQSNVQVLVDDATQAFTLGGGLLSEGFSNPSETNDGTISWQLKGTSFVATSNLTRIAFLNGTQIVGAGDNYGGLDSISVTAALPEPSTWGMMLVGFGAIGAAARRRRALVAA